LIPCRVCIRYHITILLQRVRKLHGRWPGHRRDSAWLCRRLHNGNILLDWWGRRRWCWWRGFSLLLWLGVERADFEFCLIFLEDTFIVVFPKL